MRKAVFLDRDGVINEEVEYLHTIQDLRVISGVAEGIHKLNKEGFLVIVITNQPVIARGWLTLEGLEEIHQEIGKRIGLKGAVIDAFYHCPHHPDGSLVEYKVVCECRKPGIKMITDATHVFDIDIAKSFLVGDHTRDIMAGKNAGLKTVAVLTGYGAKDGKYPVVADFIAKDLEAAADIIIKENQSNAQ